MLLMDHDMVTAVDTVDETSHFLRNSTPPPPSGWKFDTIPSSYKRAEKGWLGKTYDSGGFL